MKVAISLISALGVGLFLAANNFAPLLEMKSLYQQRRRVIIAILTGAAGFVFVMAAVLLGTIDMALQYEVQGFILWNAVLAVATGFLLAGVFSFILARWAFPKPDLEQGLFGTPQFAGIMQYIEQFKHAFEAPVPAPTPQEAAPVVPPEAVKEREEIKRRPHGDFSLEQQPGFVH